MLSCKRPIEESLEEEVDEALKDCSVCDRVIPNPPPPPPPLHFKWSLLLLQWCKILLCGGNGNDDGGGFEIPFAEASRFRDFRPSTDSASDDTCCSWCRSCFCVSPSPSIAMADNEALISLTETLLLGGTRNSP
jgi:hypothetical protein